MIDRGGKRCKCKKNRTDIIVYKHQNLVQFEQQKVSGAQQCAQRKNHVCEINIFPWCVKRGAKQNVISKAHSIVTQYIRLGVFGKN